MNTAETSSYSLHDGDVHRDRDITLALWEGNLGVQQSMRAKYDWFYLQCPYGPPLVQLLRHDPGGEWVGTCAAGRRRMLWRGREIAAGLMVDLTVRAAHRTLGPARMMQQGLITAGLLQFELLYGCPNPKAAALIRRAGTVRIAEIVRYARVLRYGAYLRRRLPGMLAGPVGSVIDAGLQLRDALRRRLRPRLHVAWSDRADQRMDALWQSSEHGDGLTAIRDAQHVRWRFDEAPIRRMRHLLLSRDGGATLCTWFCTEVVGSVLHVRDFWSDDALHGIGTDRIDVLLDAARAEGLSAVSVEIATTWSRLAGWRASGFIERGRRPVYAFTREPLGMPGVELDLHFTAADEDE